VIPIWALPGAWLTVGLLLFLACAWMYRRQPSSLARFKRIFACAVWGSVCVAMGVMELAGELAGDFDGRLVVQLQTVGICGIMLGMLVSPLLSRWAVRWYERAAEHSEFAEDEAGNPRAAGPDGQDGSPENGKGP
jgi:cytochrome bd-type quinol oxidase subunit 1